MTIPYEVLSMILIMIYIYYLYNKILPLYTDAAVLFLAVKK